jgi:hypothetical protein
MIWSVGLAACRQAIAWIAPLIPPNLAMSTTARGIADQVVFCSATCAATSRTVQPRHDDGSRHSLSDRSSNSSIRRRR